MSNPQPTTPSAAPPVDALTSLERRVAEEKRLTDRRGKTRMFVQVLLLIFVFIYLSFASNQIKKLTPDLLADYGKSYLSNELGPLLQQFATHLNENADLAVDSLKATLLAETIPAKVRDLEQEILALVHERGDMLVRQLENDETVQVHLAAIRADETMSAEQKAAEAITYLGNVAAERFGEVLRTVREEHYAPRLRDLEIKLQRLATADDLTRAEQLERDIIGYVRQWLRLNNFEGVGDPVHLPGSES